MSQQFLNLFRFLGFLKWNVIFFCIYVLIFKFLLKIFFLISILFKMFTLLSFWLSQIFLAVIFHWYFGVPYGKCFDWTHRDLLPHLISTLKQFSNSEKPFLTTVCPAALFNYFLYPEALFNELVSFQTCDFVKEMFFSTIVFKFSIF